MKKKLVFLMNSLESKLDVAFFFQSDEEGGKEKEGEEGQPRFIAHVPVPSQQEVRHNSMKLQKCPLAFTRQRT